MLIICTMTKTNWLERTLLNNFLWTLIQSRRILPMWSESMDLQPDSVVLEVGCGRGAGAIMIYDRFKPLRVDAFDVDEYMVRKAYDYTHGGYDGRINVYLGDVANIAASDGTYDAVFDFFTLHHVDDWEKGLSEISRVLKPGGYFAFAELYDTAVKSYVVKNMFRNPPEGRFGRQEWVRALAENRLRLMENKQTIMDYGMIGVTKKA
jgi:ubiquinone/menaquinone biosynthesis C-methylase UbiE